MRYSWGTFSDEVEVYRVKCYGNIFFSKRDILGHETNALIIENGALLDEREDKIGTSNQREKHNNKV